MNKLVNGNLLRGLPSKLFENDQTCVACQKGKQHRASCKSKTENSISLPLHLLHMDLFGPTFVKILMKKMYCLVVTDDYSRFTWFFFLATKDETSGILKSFITRIENLVDHRLRTRMVEENMHIRFSENTPNVVGTLSNSFAGTKASDNACQARKETKPVKITFCYHYGLLIHHFPKIQGVLKMMDPNLQVMMRRSINNVIAASINKVNTVGGKTSIELPDDPNMPTLEDISIFDLSRDNEDVGAEADMNNLDTTIQVSPIPTTRIHKDHPLNQVIGDLYSATQTRNMSKNLEEHGFVSTI
ncbi:putative ribonuclease H-like domain-containing protein [Tanacetum coccineum]